jgi:hypothetical protein
MVGLTFNVNVFASCFSLLVDSIPESRAFEVDVLAVSIRQGLPPIVIDYLIETGRSLNQIFLFNQRFGVGFSVSFKDFGKP